MRTRPALRRGDIVKLSNKGKQYPRTFDTNSTMVVVSVEGDGVDRGSVVTCRIKSDAGYEHRTFYRSELWTTRVNIFN